MLHALTTGRLCLQKSLVTSLSFRPTYAVAKRNLWTVRAELWVLWTGVPACMTVRQHHCDKTFKETEGKENVALGKDSKWALNIRYSCSYQQSGAQFIHNSGQKENKWEVFHYFTLYFINLYRQDNRNHKDDLLQYS